jgi:predicted N-acetyltransferase YhbS
MADLLVKLYALPPAPAHPADTRVRKPIGPEHDLLRAWVAAHFGPGWASEAGAALANRPVSLFVAVQGGQPVGFACYDATALGLFGPIGVAESARGRGVGAALLRACLDDMAALGYAYAVIGSAGPVEFFRREAGAEEIPGSTPGPYRGMLRPSR